MNALFAASFTRACLFVIVGVSMVRVVMVRDPRLVRRRWKKGKEERRREEKEEGKERRKGGKEECDKEDS